jgi:hypothetical protein
MERRMERRKIRLDRNETTLQQLFPWNFIFKEFKTKFLQVLSLEEFYQLLEETEAFYKNKIEIYKF